MKRIKKIPFFTDLSDDEIRQLESISSVGAYHTKEILFYEGDAPKYLHILLSGSLRLYKTNFKGTQVFLHRFYPIGLVAELANFENIPYPASAECMGPCEVLRIDYERLESDFFKNPNISLKIIKSLAGKLKIMSEVVTNEVILTAEAKIAKFIVEHQELFEKLKNTQIASILNITPETLSRTLAKFKTQEILHVDEHHKVSHIDAQSLRAIYS